MYVPEHFRESDTAKLQCLISEHSFGTLIVAGENGIEANHLPFYLNVDVSGSLGVLECHVARRNPVWQHIAAGSSVLAIFQGPHAYVSPSWYPTKAETGRVVPTWNYFAAHAEGRARAVEDADWLRRHLHRLTNRHESNRENPWSVDDAPRDFTNQLVQSIVGIEITIEKLTGKLKASQNQPETNREGVKAGLNREGTLSSDAMAKLIR